MVGQLAWMLLSAYAGGFLVAARTLPWVMDRRLRELDPGNPKAVFARTVQMLLLAAAWPVTVLLLQLTNGVLAARDRSERAERQDPPMRRPRRPDLDYPLLPPTPPLPPEPEKRERPPREDEKTVRSAPVTPLPDRRAREKKDPAKKPPPRRTPPRD